MNEDDSLPRHPIRVAGKRTGLTPATLRAWERRYRAIEPGRSEGGQRLYSDRDLQRLLLLKELTSGGRSITAVATLSDEEAHALLVEDRVAEASAAGALDASTDPRAWVEPAYASLRALDASGLERNLWNAALRLGSDPFFNYVVAPLVSQIGAGWESGELTPSHEHMASAVVERVLQRLTDRTERTDAPGIVITTLQGERHGLGARLVFAAAVLEGWTVTYLGTDLPSDDIAATAEAVGATAVAISVVASDRTPESRAALLGLRERLDPDIQIVVGGRMAPTVAAPPLPPGVLVLDGLGAFKEFSRSRMAAHSGGGWPQPSRPPTG